jgi:hypothetical protein
MEESGAGSILERTKDGILGSALRQLDRRKPDFVAVAQMKPCPKGKRQKLHAQANAEHRNVGVHGFRQESAFRPKAGVSLVIVGVLRPAHDDDAADFRKARKVWGDLVENHAAEGRDGVRQGDVDESRRLPRRVDEDENGAFHISFLACARSSANVLEVSVVVPCGAFTSHRRRRARGAHAAAEALGEAKPVTGAAFGSQTTLEKRQAVVGLDVPRSPERVLVFAHDKLEDRALLNTL